MACFEYSCSVRLIFPLCHGGGCRSWYNKANVAERNKDGELLIDVKATGGGDVLVYTGGETLYNEKIEEWKYKGLQFQQHFSMWDRN